MKTTDSFLEQVHTVIQENMANSTLNGALIAQTLGISRMQLHRCLKNLTGKSANIIIQEVRIAYAKNQLKTTSKFVYEIAQATGFKHATHFTKIFKKMTNQSPTSYRKNI